MQITKAATKVLVAAMLLGDMVHVSKAQSSQNQKSNQTTQTETSFKLLIMSNGWTKSGADWGGYTYETPDHTKVNLTIVHLVSNEQAKQEFEDDLKYAVRVITKERFQDTLLGRPGTLENRAVIIVPGKTACEEAIQVMFTAGRALRIITSCSADAALEFERQGKRGEKPGNEFVYR